MNIWVDADACPKQVKEILFRAALKRRVPVFLVANRYISAPSSPLIKRIVVDSGFDKADQYIVNALQPLDLVITGDTLLAELILERQGQALSPRGVLYHHQNIKQIVNNRNINESLRSYGMMQGGQAPLQQKEIVLFANHLDKIITKYIDKT